MGAGPMTGRAAGYCAGYGAPGFMNAGPGFGFGRGFGRGRGGGFGGGRGWRHWYHATGVPGWARAGWPVADVKPDPAALKQMLAAQAEALQAELDAVKKRQQELETDTGE